MLSSVRLRAFLGTALAALVLFGGGALWLRGYVHDSMMEPDFAQALADSQAIAAEFDRPGTAIAAAVPRQHEVWWIALEPNGRWFAASGRFAPIVSDRPEDTRGADVLLPSEVTKWTPFTIGGDPDADGRVPVIDSATGAYQWDEAPIEITFTGDLSGKLLDPTGSSDTYMAARTVISPYRPDPSEPDSIAVWVIAMPDEADAVVAVLDRALGFGVPLAVLFVAGIAWLVTGRALRPVERIRRTMVSINAHDLDHRVPVPRGRDEITRLAATTNRTLDRLARALIRQREFVADASHELRSPLATLRNAIEVGLRYEDKADWRETAEGLLTDTRRLQTLTEDLLLLARLDEGPRAVSTADLGGLVAEQVAERRHLAPDGAEYTVYGPESAIVQGGEGDISRILRNLLDNAVRHAEGRVAVGVHVGDEVVALYVEDDGPGIAPEDRGRVFERFTRLDDARARDGGGSGLGLAIVRALAVSLGGHVAVLDPGTLPGARFAVALPAA